MMKDKGLDFFIGTTFDTVRYITDCRYVPIIDYSAQLGLNGTVPISTKDTGKPCWNLANGKSSAKTL